MDKMDNSGQATAIRQWAAVNPGRVFSSNQLDSDLGFATSIQKNNRWKVVERLIEGGKVERYRGVYRVIGDGLVKMDWRGASGKPVKLSWPFSLEKYVEIYPKGIIVIAGSKNAGKTALLLNLIMQNMYENEVHYFTSELGPVQLKRRLERFEEQEIIGIDDWKFTAYERAFDFQDIIKPDAINIIDYLEVHKDFWEVAGDIFGIWNKLRNGIAVIALQKNPGAKMGLGGGRSAEKAQMYLTLDKHRLEILYGKNWAGTVNPDGMAWTFQLVGGCNFVNIQEAKG